MFSSSIVPIFLMKWGLMKKIFTSASSFVVVMSGSKISKSSF